MKELNLAGMRVKKFPLSFENQTKLEILRLEDSQIEVLPLGIKKFTKLQYLDLRNCRGLRTIPELPLSLETLLAQDWLSCGQLETMCFPSTVDEQSKENRKRIELWNRLKLDEHSRMAIGLNAGINLVKLAHLYLSSPKHNYVQSYDDYYCNYQSYQVVYAYPGSSVPAGLEHKTIDDYNVIIDLSSTPSSPHLGFIFCFLLGEHRVLKINVLQFIIVISDSVAEGNEEDNVAMYIRCPSFTDSDHVCVMYDQRCSHYLSSRAKNLTRFKIKVTPKTKCSDRVVLKGFGVSIINTSTYQGFIQQMELCCGWYHASKCSQLVILVGLKRYD